MKNKKLFITLLAALLTATSVVSCGKPAEESVESGTSDTAAVESVEETEPVETRLTPDIPTTGDYAGDEIHFLHWYHTEWEQTVRMNRDLVSDGLTGEAINDAVYNRNLAIESAYNVKITMENMFLSDIDKAVNKAVTSGDDTYDVVYTPVCMKRPPCSPRAIS